MAVHRSINTACVVVCLTMVVMTTVHGCGSSKKPKTVFCRWDSSCPNGQNCFYQPPVQDTRVLGRGGFNGKNRNTNVWVCRKPIDGYPRHWGRWSTCSASCGEGTQTRRRSCVAPKFHGKHCTGPLTSTSPCRGAPCPVDGYYRPWATWTPCSRTLVCGFGERQRSRDCVPAVGGGRPCPGPSVEVDRSYCNASPCPDPKLAPIDAPGCGLRPLVPNNGAGEQNLRKRIVGGDTSVPNSWPAMCIVYIRATDTNGRKQSYACGSTLVKNKLGVFYLITAAHCANPTKLRVTYDVYCGLHNRLHARDALSISKVTKHPKYDSTILDYDIAVFEFVDQPIESDYIKAACITNEKHIGGEQAVALGWGYTKHGGPSSNELKQVNQVIRSDAACVQIFTGVVNSNFKNSTMLCAGGEEGLCNGDSGGPLLTNTDGRWTLTGVLSGINARCGELPGVSIDVFAMRDWIDQQIN